MENPHTHRWSELVPPNSALTFAAIWDPSEGMVTFSGGHLLESDASDTLCDGESSPKEAYDSQSQVLTIDRLAWALGAGEMPGRPVGMIALDEYSEDSASVYSGETQQATKLGKQQPRIWAVGRQLLSAALTSLDGRIFRPHSRKEEAPSTTDVIQEEDEGFFEDACFTATARSFGSVPVLVNLNLVRFVDVPCSDVALTLNAVIQKSKFSVSETSTTNFVHVFPPSVADFSASQTLAPPQPTPLRASYTVHPQESSLDVWSTLPQQHSYVYPSPQEYSSSSSSSGTYGRRRRKLRRNVPLSIIPADPQEVLSRQLYNYVAPPTSYSETRGLRRQLSLAKIRELVGQLTLRCHRNGDDDEPPEVKEDRGWCWILRTGSVLEL